MLKPTFKNKIDRLCADTLAIAELNVQDKLDNYKELDASTIDYVLRAYMTTFKDSCPGNQFSLEIRNLKV
jgi:hypothetical protein